MVQKKEKVRDKLDLLVQSIQIGEDKKWVSSSTDTAYTKLMVKALFTKSPKEIQVFIEEKKKGAENKLRTKIKYGDLKWMQVDEAKNTIMILTHLPTPFEIGERGENVRGVSFLSIGRNLDLIHALGAHYQLEGRNCRRFPRRENQS